MPEIHYRFATVDDIPILVHQRHAMFAEIGVGDEEGHRIMNEAFHPWAQRNMEAGLFVSVLAMDGDEVVGGGGLYLLDWPPSPDGDTNQIAYIYNIYVEKTHRQRGIARHIVQTLLDECAARGIRRVGLHASSAGRPLYEKLGFTPTNEMRLLLE